MKDRIGKILLTKRAWLVLRIVLGLPVVVFFIMFGWSAIWSQPIWGLLIGYSVSVIIMLVINYAYVILDDAGYLK